MSEDETYLCHRHDLPLLPGAQRCAGCAREAGEAYPGTLGGPCYCGRCWRERMSPADCPLGKLVAAERA